MLMGRAAQTAVQAVEGSVLITVTQQAAIIQQNEAVFVTQTLAAQATSTQLTKEAEAAASQQQAVSDAQAAATAQAVQTAAAQTATAEAQQTAAAALITQTANSAATDQANSNATATALMITQTAEQVNALATANVLTQTAVAETPEVTPVPITMGEPTDEAAAALEVPTEEASAEAGEPTAEATAATEEAGEATPEITPEGVSAPVDSQNPANIRLEPSLGDNSFGTIKNGTPITLLCQITGGDVRDRNGNLLGNKWFKVRVNISDIATPSSIEPPPLNEEGYIFSNLIENYEKLLTDLPDCTKIPEVTPEATP
jgi:hypothetical protein